MTDPTPSDRLALALCRSILAAEYGELRPCPTPCSRCRRQSTAVARELAMILRERHGGSSRVADWLDGVGHE
jgi:hypothetical protein